MRSASPQERLLLPGKAELAEDDSTDAASSREQADTRSHPAVPLLFNSCRPLQEEKSGTYHCVLGTTYRCHMPGPFCEI
jgi:hypothetical protein